MKYVDIRDLPPCSFSPRCLRLIDDLDVPAAARSPARLSHIADFQDERQLRQLRSHVPGCPTCSALLIEARRMRTQQRLMLHHFLIANENRVPSTTGAIFTAIRREQAQKGRNALQETRASSPDVMFADERNEVSPSLPIPLHTRFSPQRSIFQNVLTLATVAAVILAAVGLFYRFSDQPSSASTQSQPASRLPSGPGTAHPGWDSVVIGLTLLSASSLARSFTAYNFNVVSNQMKVLFASTQQEAAINLEAVSGDGLSLLYKVTTPDQQRMYRAFSRAASFKNLYSLSSVQAGNAIWMDADNILIQDLRGAVLQVNTQTGAQVKIWHLKTGELTFYTQPFLYFARTESRDSTELYRINLAQDGALPQKIASASLHTHFLLSPDQTTIFYASQGSSSDEEGIYAVNSDGSHLRMVRSGPGFPIGYAEDRTLLFLQQVGTRIEVIKLGATSQPQEQIVLTNAAPGGISLCGPSGRASLISLCVQNIALDPSGQGLLLHTYYADGSHALVYDDLVTGTSSKILSLAYDVSVQLPGWSKLSSASAASTNSLACCA